MGRTGPDREYSRRMLYEGKVAIVTGGASGFGLGVAERLAAEGASVVVADVDAEGGREVARATEGLADWTHGGSQRVRGVSDPVDIYRTSPPSGPASETA